MGSRYVFVNGVMQVVTDPAQATPVQTGALPAVPAVAPLAIVSSPADIAQASAAQQKAMGASMVMASTTVSAMEEMQKPAYLNQFGPNANISGFELINGLTDFFSRNEVPIGLLNKVLMMREYNPVFIPDDSGSMNEESDVKIRDAHEVTKKNIKIRCKREDIEYKKGHKMTRWEEAENRLHIIVDILKFIPVPPIRITFLNDLPDESKGEQEHPIILSQQGKSPAQFAEEAHLAISNAFNFKPTRKTPTYTKLSKEFRRATGKTAFYFMTDGEPTDATTDEVSELIAKRFDPKSNPLALITCTNDNKMSKWMKKIEEDADYVSEIDDFKQERKEVLKDQGPAFPFTKGFWYLCQLVAAMNPDDLDALDEKYPLSKRTMDEFMGRRITPQEYEKYFYNNPHGKKYRDLDLYREFCREDVLAKQIIQHFRHAGHGNPMQPGYGAPIQAGYGSASSQMPAYTNAPPTAYGPGAPGMFVQNQLVAPQQSMQQVPPGYPPGFKQ